MPQKFDDIRVNLGELYTRILSLQKLDPPRHSALANLIKMYFIGALLKMGIYERLIYSNLVLGWFKEFKNFWISCLLEKTIDVVDYHYLRLYYRIKFQNVSHENEGNSEKFLETWQKQENLSILFHAVWYHAKTAYLTFYPFFKYLPKKGRILEYGCGTAPITQGLLKYQSHRNYEFTIADILQINFLYALYSIGRYKNVKSITMGPYENSIKKPNYYDVIFCFTVFEHLPNPLEVAKGFYESLKPGGLLIFDFIKGEGKGLDTQKAIKERKAVLEYIEKNFKIIHGNIKINDSMGLTVAKKLQNNG